MRGGLVKFSIPWGVFLVKMGGGYKSGFVLVKGGGVVVKNRGVLVHRGGFFGTHHTPGNQKGFSFLLNRACPSRGLSWAAVMRRCNRSCCSLRNAAAAASAAGDSSWGQLSLQEGCQRPHDFNRTCHQA